MYINKPTLARPHAFAGDGGDHEANSSSNILLRSNMPISPVRQRSALRSALQIPSRRTGNGTEIQMDDRMWDNRCMDGRRGVEYTVDSVTGDEVSGAS
jgi:hypothetical protein